MPNPLELKVLKVLSTGSDGVCDGTFFSSPAARLPAARERFAHGAARHIGVIQ